LAIKQRCGPNSPYAGRGSERFLTADVEVVLALALPVEGSPPTVGEWKSGLLIGRVVHLYLALGIHRKACLVHQFVRDVAHLITRVRIVGETASELPERGRGSARGQARGSSTQEARNSTLSSSVQGRQEKATSIPISAGISQLTHDSERVRVRRLAA